MRESEYSYERLDLTDGTNIMIIHNANCPAHKTFFKPKSEKKSYIKFKHHMFCKVCWEEDEARLMNMYSRANIAEGELRWKEYNYMASAEDVNYYYQMDEIKDKTNRLWIVEYSLSNEGELVKFDIKKVPIEELSRFDYVGYMVDGRHYRIPHSKENAFLKDFPTAQRLINYKNNGR